MIVSTRPELLHALPEGAAAVAPDGIASATAGYCLAVVNLGDLGALGATLGAAGWRPEEPTLLLAECLLVYMPPAASAALLRWFAERAPRAVLASYDIVGPNDPFGRTMVDNLRQRGCPLLGIHACPDLAAQTGRCLSGGWQRADTISLLEYFDAALDPAEKERVCKLELLDEFEEWRLLLSHYSLTLAVNDRQPPPIFAAVDIRNPVVHAYPPPPEATNGTAHPEARHGAPTFAPRLAGFPEEDEEDEQMGAEERR